MPEKKRLRWIRAFSFLLFFLLFILHYTDLLSLRIRGVSPLSLLPLLTAFAMFETLPAAAVSGLLVGICMDGAADTLCFHAVFLLLAASLVSVLSNNLFNKNIRAAAVLTLFLSFSYFFLRWLLFYAFTAGMRDNLSYLLYFAFPSILYTELFILPFYFLYRRCYHPKGG